jgi:hypothetical protein
MFTSEFRFIPRFDLSGTALAPALLVVLALAPPLKAQPDITNPYLPHTADSVLYDYYAWYDPAHVSDNQLGLEGVSWHSGDERTGNFFPHWVMIDFGASRTVRQLNIMAYSETPDSNLRLKDFRFEGSDDGVTFTPLHGGLLQYANQHEWQSFYFQDTPGYRYYRLFGLNNWGCYLGLCEQMIIEEWEMFESIVGACCFANGACLNGDQGECELAGGSYMGDGSTCDPNPCGGVEVTNATWGSVKSLYR